MFVFRASVVIGLFAIDRVGMDKLVRVGRCTRGREADEKSADGDVGRGIGDDASKRACGRVDGVCGCRKKGNVRGGMDVRCKRGETGGSTAGYGANQGRLGSGRESEGQVAFADGVTTEQSDGREEEGRRASRTAEKGAETVLHGERRRRGWWERREGHGQSTSTWSSRRCMGRVGAQTSRASW